MRSNVGKTRRLFLAGTLFVAVAVAVGMLAMAGTDNKIKVMLLRGGEVHDWKNNTPILKAVLDATGDFDVTFTEDLNDLKERIRDFDIIAVYTTGLTLTEQQEDGLCSFVDNGGGFVGIHSASSSFNNSERYWEMLGGRLAQHQEGKFTAYVYDSDHPITKDLKDFEIEDDTYCHDYRRNAQMRSLIRMNRGQERQSMAWVSYYGKGRVFYTGFDNDRRAWNNPDFQRLVVRAMYWSCSRQVKDPPAIK
jgi:type 1 glutamine amidotransferase